MVSAIFSVAVVALVMTGIFAFFYPPVFWRIFRRFRPPAVRYRIYIPLVFLVLIPPTITWSIRVFFVMDEQSIAFVDGATVRAASYPFSSRLFLSIDYNDEATLIEDYELVLPSHLTNGLRLTVPGDGTVVVSSRGLPVAALFVTVPQP